MYRKLSILIGILFLVCTSSTLLSFPFAGAVLQEQGFLTKIVDKQASIITGSLLEFIWAISCAGIAVAFYIILRKYNRFLALSAVILRTTEGIFVMTGTVCLLALLTLSQNNISVAGTVSISLLDSASVLTSIRYWSHNLIASVAFSLGALCYYTVLYKSGLIPKWLSGWGWLGALLGLIATLIAAYTNDFDSALNTILNVPIGLNEIVLAVWLLVKGFDQSAIPTTHAEKQ